MAKKGGFKKTTHHFPPGCKIYERTTLGEHKRERRGKGGNFVRYEKCVCSCGTTKWVNAGCLRTNRAHSCGCLQYKELSKKKTTHGDAKEINGKKSLFYTCYTHIKSRCYNPNDKGYKNYGGRGIVCEWNNYTDFKNDMYESYTKHVNEYGTRDTEIDRIDVNGNYCKENCRRVTHNENQKFGKRNLWKNKYGVEKSVLAKQYGVKESYITNQYYKLDSDFNQLIKLLNSKKNKNDYPYECTTMCNID